MLTLVKDNTINLIEIFSSVQGETHLSGLPTVFVRTAACNLRCTWCDTNYSFGRGTPTTIDSIVKEVEEAGLPHVCITGGEPLLQKNIHQLMSILCDRGYTVSIETGGSLPINNIDARVITILDIKCPGSGMESKNLWENIKNLRPHDEIKFVILDRNDYDYTKKVIEKYHLKNRKHPVLLSPVHDELESKQLVEWILEDKLPVRLNLQLHKFIWTPQTRGV
ncbi:MAG: radical SAM protein [Chlamydiota bacterium]|nr:radical SAM protein [Chlamydiota bacterium]